ncbi:MAG: tRNA 5-methoxyuridine(34)/uridine 5-oxyacetic acid(34) synthase CmoB [Planctomycetaceae bacterium]
MFDFDGLFAELRDEGDDGWSDLLRARCAEALSPGVHGHLAEWTSAVRGLPDIASDGPRVIDGRVTIGSNSDISAEQRETLHSVLRQFCPWRKGPFDLFGIHIDSEWRSDRKWDRLAGHIDLRNCSVLDVGCGNGYYGWRMLDAGARRVVGFDPFLLYVMQHEIVKRYADHPVANYVLPLSDDALQSCPRCFDVTFSMGVLYHRTSPIDHLQSLFRTIKPGGRLVLETLVTDRADAQVLVPEGRYAKMRNVWFIPSIRMLELWLKRTGFDDVKVVDVTATSSREQRRTDWMTFESLSDFLDPRDATRTIEGHPAPIRAIATAVARP